MATWLSSRLHFPAHTKLVSAIVVVTALLRHLVYWLFCLQHQQALHLHLFLSHCDFSMLKAYRPGQSGLCRSLIYRIRKSVGCKLQWLPALCSQADNSGECLGRRHQLLAQLRWLCFHRHKPWQDLHTHDFSDCCTACVICNIKACVMCEVMWCR